MTPNTTRLIGLSITAGLAIAACGSDEPASDDASEVTTSSSADAADTTETVESDADTTDTVDTTDESGGVGVGLDPAAFFDGALVGDVATTDCTTASGTKTSCYELTVAGFPSIRDAIGPWCPETTSDDTSDAGIWFDGNDVYDISGQFILDLAEIYDDPTWKLYDEDGNVLSTDTSEEFNDLVNGGPADPDAGPVNLCVYGEIEWADGGGPIPATVEIPVIPVKADSPTSAGTIVGVTLDGVRIDGSAPMDLILGNYTIGAFDPCGGHVNPQEGYHMHATTGCSDSEGAVSDGETAMFGYALDGYAIHGPYDESAEADAGLDQCNGHEANGLGYHYHANPAAENAVLTCLVGETTEATTGGGGPPNGGGAGG